MHLLLRHYDTEIHSVSLFVFPSCLLQYLLYVFLFNIQLYCKVPQIRTENVRFSVIFFLFMLSFKNKQI